MNFDRIEYTQKEKYNIILKHFLLMLERRNLINDYELTYKKFENEISDNEIIKINKKISLYIHNGKLTTISSNSPIDNFLNSDQDILKFIIITDPQKKVYNTIMDFQNSEMFFTKEFMKDPISHVFVPQHILLSDTEKEEFLKSYPSKSLSKIKSTDMISRYYGAKRNDIFKIIRKTENGNVSISYRIVSGADIELLYPKKN